MGVNQNTCPQGSKKAGIRKGKGRLRDVVKALNEQKLLDADASAEVLLLSEMNDKSALQRIAKDIMARYGSKKLAVLHTLDQVAVGIATKYGDGKTIFGNSQINTHIGTQWPGQIKKIDNATLGVDPKSKMDVELK